ncbi:MAG TPA: chemotaxis-specific protein-glutamate methyltransferase CheB [Vicinamibacteria bacterium]|nr:chemotaxis-specific protein-glutamate methyltransferase CheB [Vicinamibacteria bacterium]
MSAPTPGRKSIHVLLVEDSAVIREYLAAALGADPAIDVVGVAHDGVEAVEMAERLRPDVILMDVHMPRMGGLEATREIMSRFPAPIVLITASFDRNETAASFDILKAGALTVLDKPGGLHDPATLDLVRTVKLMAEVQVVRRWPARPPREAPLSARNSLQKIRLVAIGASTGGPAALMEVLSQLKGTLTVPVVVVQHIAPGFTAGLAEWLSGQTSLAVRLARDGEALRPGVVYLAPDGRDMAVGGDARVRLARGAADGFFPTVDHLFASVAEAYGPSALGVLLTGMGRDGGEGLRRMRAAGAATVAQDEATSVVFGMPGEAVRLGAAEHVLPPVEIGRMIRALADRQGGHP